MAGAFAGFMSRGSPSARLGDDVPLDLVRPAVDRLRPAEQEQPLPFVEVGSPRDHGRRAEDLHGQLAEALVPAGPQDLQDRGLGAPSPGPPRVSSA